MNGIEIVEITDSEVDRILAIEEGHFADLKAIEIAPAKLSRSISAFSNAEGGELYLGIDEDDPVRTWRGFADVEDANGHLQTFDTLFPLGDGYSYIFLRSQNHPGVVLKIEVAKSRIVRLASNNTAYLRRGAQNLPQSSPEQLERLRRTKGLSSFETETVAADPSAITDSLQILEFMVEVVPSSEAEPWLRKQNLLRDDKPTVAGLILFSDEPQIALPKQCGIKLYRYNTKEEEGTRETLDFDPISIEGSAYSQIYSAVKQTSKIIQSVRIMTAEGLKPAEYPHEALHEIVTNAVLHRDYGISDDIHIRIFDNRVDVLSPGKLPAHITPENILNERFARNGVIVRLINKFPNPPNKDVGEGLNTAFSAMKQMNLKDPEVEQVGEYVRVRLKHESLGTPQELIIKYLSTHSLIANKQVRDITNIRSENSVKHILQRMVASGELEVVKGKTLFDTKYRKT
ncbi:MAG: ATP-binding protein [Planctomycetales bacterium]